jgi:hypothetical protein
MGSHLFQSQLHVITQQAIKLGKEIFQEALKEPYFFCDIYKKTPPEISISAVLLTGELFLLEKDNKIVAFASFRNVVPHIKASLELYILPAYRKTLVLGNFRDILEKAAFAPFPEGLQLLKLTAAPHTSNTPSLKACAKAGFIALADLPFDAIYLGQVSTMRHMELYPKEVRQLLGVQEIPNASLQFRPKRESPKSDISGIQQSGELQLTDLQPISLRGESQRPLPNGKLPKRISTRKQRTVSRHSTGEKPLPLPESSG